MTVKKDQYQKPALTLLENLKDITFECAEWQCSVVVPGPPSA